MNILSHRTLFKGGSMQITIIFLLLSVLIHESYCFEVSGHVYSVIDRKPIAGVFLRFSDHFNDTPDCSNANFYDSVISNDSGGYTFDWIETKNTQNYAHYIDFSIFHPEYVPLCVSSQYCNPDQLFLVPLKDSSSVVSGYKSNKFNWIESSFVNSQMFSSEKASFKGIFSNNDTLATCKIV